MINILFFREHQEPEGLSAVLDHMDQRYKIVKIFFVSIKYNQF